MTLESCPFSIGNTSSNGGPFTNPPLFFFGKKATVVILGLEIDAVKVPADLLKKLGCRVGWVEQTH